MPQNTTPPRKRRRLSSPTYDDQLGVMSQEDLDAFDLFEAKLAQVGSSQSPVKPVRSQEGRGRRAEEIANALRQEAEKENRQLGAQKTGKRVGSGAEKIRTSPLKSTMNEPQDDENPFIARHNQAHQLVGNSTRVSGFVSAASKSLADFQRSPSPEAPPDVDYSAWFSSKDDDQNQNGFAAATTLDPAPVQVSAKGTSFPGFGKASGKGWTAPSADAIAKAEERMKVWQDEPTDESRDRALPKVSSSEQPLPSNRNTPNQKGNPVHFRRPEGFDSSPSTISSKPKSKQFKSPLINPQPNKPLNTSTVFNQASSIVAPNPVQSFGVASILTRPHLSTRTSESPERPSSSSSSFSTPVRALGVTPRRGPSSKPFTTPFKTGYKPGDPGRENLVNRPPPKPTTSSTMNSWYRLDRHVDPKIVPRDTPVFDLRIPKNRVPLPFSGHCPQRYVDEELQAMGVDVTEMLKINPETAQHYSFHNSPVIPLDLDPTSKASLLGPPEAAEHLLSKGCWLVTQAWVENHWGLIMWKLAGMAMMDPENEENLQKRLWSWNEVIRQLLYRYEREINTGIRPLFRLITTQDAPSTLPMVVCVSDIIWPEGTSEASADAHPELEVTDGWYRLRAQVDAPLARAIRKGSIRVGRKIGVAGARLTSKEAMEVLSAYDSVKFIFTGNSTHLAPWHAKLGFQKEPFTATLNSLTADGDLTCALEIVVNRVHPIAFIEYIKEDGVMQSYGPFCEADDAKQFERWQRKREAEGSRLREDLQKKFSRFESYAERLEMRLLKKFSPGAYESMPDYIEDIYERLEDPDSASRALTHLTSTEAGWLARYIRENLDKDRDNFAEMLAQELDWAVPQRQVRSFRVLIVGDAETRKRPATRVAQLTVWDVLSITHSEGGKAGAFEIGQKFRVTNLVPSHKNAWMGREPDAQVFLASRRDSRWTLLK